jgi:phage terminase Nu1 subunit (DNA packaging protein)
MKCNRNKLARILGKDVKTIDKMVADGMPYLHRPGDASGAKAWMFDSGAVVRWVTGAEKDHRLSDAKERIDAAIAALKELELGEKRGDLVRVEDVLTRVVGGDAIIKSRLRAIPGRVAHLVAVESDPAKAEAILRKEVKVALSQLDLPWNERG